MQAMSGIIRKYRVTNAVMGADFRLTALGAQILVQDCFASYMAMYHHAAFDLKEQSLMWIISEFSMRFMRGMPYWGDSVDVELWLSEEPEVRVYVDYRISSNGNVFCKGDGVWAILDMASRRPARASEILSDMEWRNESLLGTHRHRLAGVGEEQSEFSYRTVTTDTDFNGHVSNVAYIRLCKNSMPAGYWSDHKVVSLDMKFQHESFLGQELLCKLSGATEADNWHYVITDEEGHVCCEAAAVCRHVSPEDEAVNLESLEIRKG